MIASKENLSALRLSQSHKKVDSLPTSFFLASECYFLSPTSGQSGIKFSVDTKEKKRNSRSRHSKEEKARDELLRRLALELEAPLPPYFLSKEVS